ncbi:ASCH domain-containing protein [[Kitasatospora] papulosa]|uniref:hypothetical protein n=1 Tax=[Kitasatospora] papulosa TaxID=1464011 RepID=UPI0036BFB1D8
MPETELPPVRGLTIKQPWAWAITAGKNVENRSWKVPEKYIGATLLVHAGLRPAPDAFLDARILSLPAMPPRLAAGKVLAVARLAGCHREEGGCCAPWGDADAFHWQLEDVRPLPEPLKYTGALSLWTPSPALLQKVQALPLSP